MSKATKSQVKGTLVKIDGTYEDIVREGNSWKLEDLQKLVGGYVELIPLPSGRNVMLADEDGMPKQLKPNGLATIYAGRPVVGDVVIIQRRDFK